MDKKCHQCKHQVLQFWNLGPLVFCSEKCLEEARESGETGEGWVFMEGDLFYIGVVKAEP